MTPHKVIIDTDPGVDDAMAILFACVHANVDLVGLTSVFGNVTTPIATRNALVLAELAGQSIAVARGADRPLVQQARPVADFVHGREGFGDVPPRAPRSRALDIGAAEFICNTVNASPGEIVLCPVGPLTNIALALEKDPGIADKVKRVVVMGGSVEAGGNATAYAEANIWQDPHAARMVFDAFWDVTLVGLDITHQVICAPEEFAALADAAPVLGGFLNQAAQFYFRFHEENDGIRGCHMHDPTAVIAITHPELFKTTESVLDVALDGARVGQTRAVAEPGRHSVKWCSGVDAEAVREIFLSTLSASN